VPQQTRNGMPRTSSLYFIVRFAAAALRPKLRPLRFGISLCLYYIRRLDLPLLVAIT
jgi:hypothetical protein